VDPLPKDDRKALNEIVMFLLEQNDDLRKEISRMKKEDDNNEKD
jgi:hypothetical protein